LPPLENSALIQSANQHCKTNIIKDIGHINNRAYAIKNVVQA